MPKLIILYGASGVGKTTAFRKLVELDNFAPITKYTTRVERGDYEKDPDCPLDLFYGRTEEQVKACDFCYEFNNSYYGIDNQAIQKALDNDSNPVLIVRDCKTIGKLKVLYPNSLVFYIFRVVSAKKVTEFLEKQGRTDIANTDKRLRLESKCMNEYMENMDLFDFCIPNRYDDSLLKQIQHKINASSGVMQTLSKIEALNAFISWSSPRGERLAECVKNWLMALFSLPNDPWTSFDNAEKGKDGIQAVAEALRSSNNCIVCLTSDTYNNPWPMFEAGAVFKGDNAANIWTIAFNFEKSRLANTPLGRFQHTVFDKEDMYKLAYFVQATLEPKPFKDHMLLREAFDRHWCAFENKVNEVLCATDLGGENMDKKQFIEELRHSDIFPAPDEGLVTTYSNGYETTDLYRILLTRAQKRLWIFGRKNSKLFVSNEFGALWGEFKEKIDNEFDFRCLFLNPTSDPNLINKAQDDPQFLEKLNISIVSARNKLEESGIDPSSVCKFYSLQRTNELIVIDDVVLYTTISYGKDTGKPLHLTNSAFNVVEAGSTIGKTHIDSFVGVWEKGENF